MADYELQRGVRELLKRYTPGQIKAMVVQLVNEGHQHRRSARDKRKPPTLAGRRWPFRGPGDR